MTVINYQQIFLLLPCLLLLTTRWWCSCSAAFSPPPSQQPRGRRRRPPLMQPRILSQHRMTGSTTCPPIDNDDADNDANENSEASSTTTTMTSIASSSSCPFERTFPRYKIDLQGLSSSRRRRSEKHNRFVTMLLDQVLPSSSSSSNNKKTNNLNNNNNGLPNMLRKVQAQAQERRLASKYPQCQKIIVDTSGLDGPHAMALLWQSAADLLLDANNKNSNFETVILLHLGNDQTSLLQNFVEMFQWAWEHVPDLRQLQNDGVVLQAEYLAEDKALRLVLTMTTTTVNSKPSTTTLNDNKSNPLVLEQQTQAWVKRVLVKMGICPFTKSVHKSGQGLADVGVPVGQIAYLSSLGNNAIVLLADTWKAICEFLDAGPEAQSSILLVAPFYNDDFATWAGPVFCLLETTVVAARAEADVGVVCFHPLYATPDGTTWPGFGHMYSVPRLMQWIKQEQEQQQKEQQKKLEKSNFNDLDTTTVDSSDSTTTTTQRAMEDCSMMVSRQDVAAGGAWQRRTPHATINVLRADQLARAESRRNSATLYPRNIRALLAVGNAKLAADLEREQNLHVS